MSTDKLPRVFIGSSAEALNIAYALQANIEYDSEPTVWTQGIFKPSQSTLSNLVQCLAQFDFAVFVFNVDDISIMRDQRVATVRDNVLFELGLFMGRVGVQRCFILKARETTDLHLPTDLLGIEPLTFSAKRSDGNLQAALGPAAHTLRQTFSLYTSSLPQTIHTRTALQRYMDFWNSSVLTADRARARQGLALNMMEADDTDRETLSRLVAFIETVCDSALRGEIAFEDLENQFGSSIRAIYEHARHFWRLAAHDGPAWESAIVESWLSQSSSERKSAP